MFFSLDPPGFLCHTPTNFSRAVTIQELIAFQTTPASFQAAVALSSKRLPTPSFLTAGSPSLASGRQSEGMCVRQPAIHLSQTTWFPNLLQLIHHNALVHSLEDPICSPLVLASSLIVIGRPISNRLWSPANTLITSCTLYKGPYIPSSGYYVSFAGSFSPKALPVRILPQCCKCT